MRPDQAVRDSHSGGHKWLELPLFLLTVQEEPVHDLVLLLRGYEVLDDQVPGSRNEVEMGNWGGRDHRGHAKVGARSQEVSQEGTEDTEKPDSWRSEDPYSNHRT